MTLRSHLERMQSDAAALAAHPDWPYDERRDLLRRIERNAIAALGALDGAERASTWFNGENCEDLRLVPDPEPS